MSKTQLVERIADLEAYVDQLETQNTRLSELLVAAMGSDKSPVPKSCVAEFLMQYATPGTEFPDEVAGWLMLDSDAMLSGSEAEALINKYDLTYTQLNSYMEEFN